MAPPHVSAESSRAIPPDAAPPRLAFDWRTALPAFLFAWAALLGYDSVRFGLDSPPAASGDEVDYDNLGWSLSRGRGFSLDTGDPEFRRPYDLAAQQDPLYQLRPPRSGPITYRPPLFPAVIAVTDLLAGRQFWLVRVFNAACLAGVCGLLAGIVRPRYGLATAVIVSALFVVVDVRVRLYGRAILTEASSALWVAVIALELEAFRRRPAWPRSLLLGITVGLAILTRSLFSLWLPGLMAMIFWLGRRRGAGTSWPAALGHSAIFVCATLLVLAPWAVRNSRLLGEFYPLGTQGHAQLSAAFGDEVWSRRGEWTHLEDAGFFDEVTRPDMTLLEWELASAQHSRARAWEWIRAHPGKSLALAWWKNWQEFRPRSIAAAAILALAIIGGVLGRRDPLVRIGWGLILANCLAIAATWSVEGRFLVPLLFVFHYFAAVTIAAVTSRLASAAGMRFVPRMW